MSRHEFSQAQPISTLPDPDKTVKLERARMNVIRICVVYVDNERAKRSSGLLVSILPQF